MPDALDHLTRVHVDVARQSHDALDGPHTALARVVKAVEELLSALDDLAASEAVDDYHRVSVALLALRDLGITLPERTLAMAEAS